MKDAIRRGLADFRDYRYLHSICVATIALSVFVISAFGLFLLNTGDLMASWTKGIRIIAYLAPETDEKGREAIMEAIQAYPGVAGVEYVSSEEALEWLKKEVGRQTALLEGLVDNPLPDAVEVSLSADIEGAGDITALAGKMESLSGVADVEYARQWIERFGGIYNLFRLTSIILIGLIIAAIMMIVANTIRLILYSRIDEIKITRIIGADDAFIKYPLYCEGVMLGFAGGLAGLLLLYAAFAITVPQLSSAGLLFYFQVRFLPATMVVFILLASMTVGWLGCYLSIRRFLKV
ncbi:MAG: permease-like cell division protein FtsX [Desulfosalsimonadaceae bacterium]